MPIECQVCKVCRAQALDEIEDYRLLPRVTSDCIAFRDGGRLLVCGHCGAAQSAADEQWRREIEDIYSTYYPYHQAGGMEQPVFDATSGRRKLRSEVIVEKMLAVPGFPHSGLVLDVGCGNGWTLKAFSQRGGWRLQGLELNDRNLHLLESIKGFERLHTCEPQDLPEQFDVLSMVHALEHFPEPLAALRKLRSKLASAGRLFVQVPNAEVNPFDYLIADHMMHFTYASLASLAAAAGYQVDSLSVWVPKELSLVAQPVLHPAGAPAPAPTAAIIDGIHAQISWLRRFIDAAREASTEGSAGVTFGLFGTSIAGTWLAGVLGERVTFFVDEDPHRVGRMHMGRPILTPAQVPRGSILFIALTPAVAAPIAERFSGSGLDLRLPPE
jgi:2-polyprenyl-3-methyl-5-hydroxy-6-metoxy-1,4-benzoquinol methylase